MPDTPPTAILTAAAIAAHWGVDGSYVRRLRMETSDPRMPDFAELGADHPDRFKLVDEWRAVHAPPRRRRTLPDRPDEKKSVDGGSSAPNNPEAAGKWWTSATHNQLPENQVTEAELDAERARIGDDFEGWALRTWERAALMAARRHREAMASGDGVRSANALGALNETLRRAREQREAWLDLQERSRRVISIDRALDLLAPVLNAVERRLKNMGKRVGPDANPAEPDRAARAIDAEIDLLAEQMSAALLALEEARQSPVDQTPTAAA